jgi:two-component system, NarL family, captular synthesis response regulator RcsB
MTIAHSSQGIRSAAPRCLIDEGSVQRYMLSARPRHRIRISILDDHPIIGLGMASFLHYQSDFDIIQTETSAIRFLDTLKEVPCDVAVVDFYLPRQPWDGVDFIKRLRREHPGLVVITFSGGRTADTEYAAYKAGAHGYVPKGERLLCIADVIRQAVSSPRKFHRCSDGELIDDQPPKPDDRLTAAEMDVLRNIALGLSVTQISAKLLRSKKTISTHKRRAMKKLELADDLALAMYLREKFEPSSEF